MAIGTSLFGISTYGKSATYIYNPSTYIPNILKIISIGDPHIYVGSSIVRLTKIKDYINNNVDADIAVIVGDITDNGNTQQFTRAKSITDKIEIQLYVVIGNHDLYHDTSTNTYTKTNFEATYGATKHIEIINGFQLLFIGMNRTANSDGSSSLAWDFDFDTSTNLTLNKSLPTIVFIHGPAFPSPTDCTCCDWDINGLFGYAMGRPYDIRTELAQFTNLIAIYSGHIHLESQQVIRIGNNNVRCITNAALKTGSIGQCDAPQPKYIAGIETDYIGYSVITTGATTSINYQLVKYNTADTVFWLSRDPSGNGAIYLNGQDNSASINDLDINNQSPIEVSHIPRRGPEGTVGITVTGNVKEIRIEGTFVNLNVDELRNKVAMLKSMMDGTEKDVNGDMGYHFRNGMQDYVARVAIIDFKWNLVDATPAIVKYNLYLKEIGHYG